MSRNIRRVAFFFGLCFLGLSPALVYWQVMRAEELLSRSDNPRPALEELRQERGIIYDRNNQRLVKNEVGSDGYVRRIYAQPSLAHIIGFFSSRFGLAGIERSLNNELTGKKGGDMVTTLQDQLLHRPTVGNDIKLTIDLRLQQAVEAAMGGAKGGAVVIEPRTGEILAMISNPTFDANRLSATSGEDNKDRDEVDNYWKELKDNSDNPLLNRATQGVYTPGSTFKTVTLAAALETRIVEPSKRYDFVLNPPNAEHPAPWHENEYVSCHNHTQASLDLVGAYGYSCNVVFSELGLAMGSRKFLDFALRFGLESSPPLEIPVEKSRVFRRSDFFSGDERYYALASSAMGQGELSVTPLQMALISSAIANDGMVLRPFLVSEVRKPTGEVIMKNRPSTWKVAVNVTTARLVKDIMVRSVEDGWAKPAAVAGVKVAGKTGSAEYGGKEKPHSWFIGFAPADDPQVAIAVVKENRGYGSDEAAPVAKSIFEAALK